MSNQIQREIELRNDLAELPRLADEVEQFATAADIGASEMLRLQLVVDEAVTNSITHGLPADETHQIRLSLVLAGGEVEIQIEDDGVDYNPLETAPPDLSAGVGEREVGGLGIHLIRGVMDAVEYTRVDSCNRLTMRKRIGQ